MREVEGGEVLHEETKSMVGGESLQDMPLDQVREERSWMIIGKMTVLFLIQRLE